MQTSMTTSPSAAASLAAGTPCIAETTWSRVVAIVAKSSAVETHKNAHVVERCCVQTAQPMESIRLSAVLTIVTVKVLATDKAFLAEQLWQEGLLDEIL